jgi:ABC-2 type transport system ATP-binding protein
MIQVERLTKRYGPTVAVRDISFSVPRGEILGFLGPNGAGKTTTMRILTGYLPADEGTVRVAGFDVAGEGLEVRRRLGYLPESAPLYEEMGVVDYLEYVAGMRGFKGEERTRRVKRMIDVCGLGPMIAKSIGQLSKGYRQRVGLAQAMIHDPDLLVLDEPTSGLDPNQIVEIRDLIRTLGREKTVLLSTHILPEVQATCSRVMIIARGEIVADDTPEGLARKATGGRELHATIEGPGPDIEGRLAAAAAELGAARFEGTTPRGGLRCRLSVPDAAAPEEAAAALFRLAAARGWTLTELRHESASLEEIFRSLTGGPTGAGGAA